MKLVGGVGTKDAGALAVVMSVMDGKVQSTMHTIRGAKFGSTVVVSKLLAGTDKEVKINVDLNLDIFLFPGPGVTGLWRAEGYDSSRVRR